MLQTGSLVLGIVLIVIAVTWLVRRVRSGGRSAQARESLERHHEAQAREPPVDVGDVCTFGIEEFTDHHSGARRAVGRVEGFVVFVEDVPDDVALTDAVRVKILSFNRGHTSARAAFLERA
ncbi:TRAM domain-containing protein [Natronobiforma cellulositropha]|uniref:TRAM domain-containing protein n=1 Tax=Natronobiforma cellulositropha TaxID=1679076 RepID=UPI0021D5DD56|nr:RNA-binding protein [Natronobiforma cellulositropha]